MKTTLMKGVALFGAFGLGYAGFSGFSPDGAGGEPPPMFVEPGVGTEIAVIMFVATGCAWSAHLDLVPAWETIVRRMESKPPEGVDRTTRVGIGIARAPREGFEFLDRFGEFHEISVGRDLNNGVLRYAVNDLRGPVATPQVIVVRREFETRKDGSIYRKSETVLQRLVGLESIRRAAERSPLPVSTQ